MQDTDYSSKLLNNAVAEFAKLPGIGSKTALRLVLHLLKKTEEDVTIFGETMIELKQNIKKCKVCKNVSDHEICDICNNQQRDKEQICIVENINDVIAIEKTRQYNGLYHVLGGLISPMDGIGPDNLEIEALIDRVANQQTEEIIFALNTTPEGDTTNYYLFKKISAFNVKVTALSKGVSIGSELQYTDEVTLGRSIVNRIIFEN